MTFFLTILVLGMIFFLLWLHYTGVWNLTTGLNIECHDVLCEMRRPLEYYKGGGA